MKKSILLLIGILNFQLAFSQENYIPGYVIKNSKDTVYGFVDYRNWSKNPDMVNFKKNIEDDPISFNPTNTIEFMVNGEIYVSGIINSEVSSIETVDLREDGQLNIKVDTTFLQTLFRGKKSLYFYKNPDGRENFYISQDSGFQILIYKRYLRQQDGKRLITENRKYLGQLAVYLNDCGTINSKLENTSYKLKSLVKLFQYYYRCSPSDISFQKEIEKVEVQIGVLAGVSLTSLEFRSSNFAYLAEAQINSSIDFSTGIFFDLIFPRNQRKWSMNNEILFSTYKFMGTYEYEESNYYSSTTTEIGYSYLKMNNLIRFKYPIGDLFLFLNAGISNGFAISETNYKKEESRFFATERVVEELALDDTRKYEQGYILGTGINYDRFSLEIRYEQGTGMSEYVGLNSLTRRYFFLLGYRL